MWCTAFLNSKNESEHVWSYDSWYAKLTTNRRQVNTNKWQLTGNRQQNANNNQKKKKELLETLEAGQRV